MTTQNQTIDPHLASQFDRLPPHDLDAERCVLAAMMLDAGMLARIRGILRADDFYQPEHQIIYAALVAMADATQPVDAVTLRAELHRRQILEDVGGTAYIAQLLGMLPSSAHGEHYAKIVKEAAILRGLIAQANELLRQAYSPRPGAAAAELAMSAAQHLIDLAARGTKHDPITIGQAAEGVLRGIEAAAPKRIATGIPELDEIIGGMGIGETTIIAGSPGSGKSMLAKQIAHHVAGTGVPVGIVSIEESAAKIATNRLAAESGVPNHIIAHATPKRDEWARLVAAAQRMSAVPLHIVDYAMDLAEVESGIHQLVAKHGCRVVVVDHVHLIHVDDCPTREREIGKISATMKRTFRRLEVAGVLLAQLNRQVGPGERPSLRSLRDSGSLEADGDVIIALHRSDLAAAGNPDYTPNGEIELAILKNKGGRTAIVRLAFDGAAQTVRSWVPDFG